MGAAPSTENTKQGTAEAALVTSLLILVQLLCLEFSHDTCAFPNLLQQKGGTEVEPGISPSSAAIKSDNLKSRGSVGTADQVSNHTPGHRISPAEQSRNLGTKLRIPELLLFCPFRKTPDGSAYPRAGVTSHSVTVEQQWEGVEHSHKALKWNLPGAILTCVLVLGFVHLPVRPFSDYPDDVELVHTALAPVAFRLSPLPIPRTTDSAGGKSSVRHLRAPPAQRHPTKKNHLLQCVNP